MMFGRGQLDALERHRALDQPLVGGDEGEGTPVGEADVVEARVGGVQHPEADALVTDGQVRVVGAVDEDGIAEALRVAAARGAVGEVEGAVRVEVLVLDDDRDVVDTILVRQRQGAGDRVVDDVQAGEAAVGLVAGRPGELLHAATTPATRSPPMAASIRLRVTCGGLCPSAGKELRSFMTAP